MTRILPDPTQTAEAMHSASPVTGTHCLLELSGCPYDLLNDEAAIRLAIRDAADKSGSTLLQLTSHAFSPCGVTALGLLAESHISVHTWPEKGYAAVDIFTCGPLCCPQDACALLADRFGAEYVDMQTVTRGSRTERSHPQDRSAI